MNILIIYDSAYGNTAKIAEALAVAAKKHGRVTLLPVVEAQNKDLEGVDMLIIGSPTQGGRPTQPIQAFLNELPELDGMPVAAFDTRFAVRGHGPLLGLLMKVIGYAAEKMSKTLESKGGKPALPAQGFIVEDNQGPLREGEQEKATQWMQAAYEFA